MADFAPMTEHPRRTSMGLVEVSGARRVERWGTVREETLDAIVQRFVRLARTR